VFAIRHSGAAAPNTQVTTQPAKRGEGNLAWLERTGVGEGVLLLGGSQLTDVRLRVAQSRLRSDISPSHWSFAGLLSQGVVVTSPLDAIGDPGEFAARNGVRRLDAAIFDDPQRYPNIAVLVFTAQYAPVFDALEQIESGRAVLDVPALVVAWLAALWAVDELDEPLREGRGMPGAAVVALAHAIAGLQLTPGLESTATCPEAIWQAARWWADFYRESAAVALRAGAAQFTGHAEPAVPAGMYAIRSRLVEPLSISPREVTST
jgi:hypothetical protein